MIIVLRQFYAGHAYNSSQMVAGCLLYHNGTVVFYGEKASTDQVAGVGSSLKRDIGRERIKEQMISRLERLRSAIRSFYVVFFRSGNPQQRAYIEGYNRTVRYHWLEQYLFDSLQEIQTFTTDGFGYTIAYASYGNRWNDSHVNLCMAA